NASIPYEFEAGDAQVFAEGAGKPLLVRADLTRERLDGGRVRRAFGKILYGRLYQDLVCTERRLCERRFANGGFRFFEMDADTRQHFGRREAFDHVVDRAVVQPFEPTIKLASGRQENQRD